jgi:hypothetical protein
VRCGISGETTAGADGSRWAVSWRRIPPLCRACKPDRCVCVWYRPARCPLPAALEHQVRAERLSLLSRASAICPPSGLARGGWHRCGPDSAMAGHHQGISYQQS